MIKKFITCILVCSFCSCTGLLKNQTKPLNTEPFAVENASEKPAEAAENFSEIIESFDPASPADLTDQADPPSEIIFDQALEFCQMAQELWQKGEIDNALLSLDQAYSLIIKVDTVLSPKLFQHKEDLRFMISKRILEIYASRNIVVNGTHNPIPVIINKQVQKEIDLFLNRERRFFKQSLIRSGSYRPMMLKALKNAGLPPELAWLPLVESGFKVTALSKARALGLWQFIPSTGYMYGLKRDHFTDERLDPEKATNAAIAYLKKLHRLFGDWSTVLAAYNCGEGRILRIIRTQNINYLDNFWDLYNKLPSETARYVPRFLATLHIVNNLEKYGFDKVIRNTPMEYDEVTISKQVKLRDIAKIINSTEKQLVLLNPELRHKILPKEEYKLKVLKGTSEKLLAGIDSLKVSILPQKAFVYHRVRPGEALSTIAMKYRTSTRAIVRANGISKRNFIVAGKVLKIPRRGYVPNSYSPPKNISNFKKDLISMRHIVKRGDSLWIIARKYDTTVTKIKSLNHLSGSNLRIGQKLSLPDRHGKRQNVVATNKSGTYYVKHGDSPFAIAKQHNVALSYLLKLNSLSAKSTIYPGQMLYTK